MPFDLFRLVGWDLEAEVRRIARAAGAAERDIAQLVATAKTIAAGVAAGFSAAAAAGGAGGSPTVRPGLPLLEGGWQVGTIQESASDQGTVFTVRTPGGTSPSVQTSMLSAYQDAAIFFATGQASSIAFLAVSGGIVSIVLNDRTPVSPGEAFTIYGRPPGVDATGVQRTLVRQLYTVVSVIDVPAGTTAAVQHEDRFQPDGAGIEMHRGQAWIISAKGYAYNLAVTLLLTAIAPNGSQIQAPQSGLLKPVSTYIGWQVFAMEPPGVSNLLQVSLTPQAAGAADDVVTILWFLDGNDTAIDQDPSGLFPLQVSRLAPGVASNAQVHNAVAQGTQLVAEGLLFSADFVAPVNGSVLLSFGVSPAGNATAVQHTRDGSATATAEQWFNLRRGRLWLPGDEYGIGPIPLQQGQKWNARVTAATTVGFVQAFFVPDA